MHRQLIMIVVAVGLFLAVPSSIIAAEKQCPEKDEQCREFARLAEAEQYDKIIGAIDAKINYSDASRSFIGQAYLMIAGRETNTPEQEEQFCRKALEYGSTSAYMGLYFIYASKDTEAALGFLKQYLATKPNDSVPYVILGEAELEKKNYQAADAYLREAKKIARGHSANLEWLSFLAGYLTGDYAYAGAMLENALLESAMKKPEYEKKLRALASDPRFSGMEKRPEFKQYEYLFKGAAR
jgi:tetratricopeptide (TPR) repeat protein